MHDCPELIARHSEAVTAADLIGGYRQLIARALRLFR